MRKSAVNFGENFFTSIAVNIMKNRPHFKGNLMDFVNRIDVR
ncbi:hypothetical protein HifGL_000966 [Haemophilus influenzae KR494]|nr:hypothetical protein HifGL_000966 [Haemophilus influenzae KR494]